MMKKHFLKGIFLCLCLFSGTNTFAYDAEIDGIYYNFSGDEAIVTNSEDWEKYYSGAVVIPASVTHNGKTYSVTSIGEEAFSELRLLQGYLTSVTIPSSVTSIGDDAFDCCENLISVNIPDGVTSIGDDAFWGCDNLPSVTIPSSVTSIGNNAFKYCFFKYDKFINNSVLSSGDNWGATLCDVETNDGLLIKNNVAVMCRSWATSVTIPNGVESIGENCFRDQTSINIPNSVTSIHRFAFDTMSNMTQLKIYKEDPWDIDIDINNHENATLYVPYGCKADYECFENFRTFKEIIEMPNPNSVTVGSSGFATFCSPNNLDFSDVTDIKAYIASDFDPSTYTLTLTRITEAPAEEGLYIVGTPGTYTIDETTTGEVYSNLLTGITYPTTINPTDGTKTNFILANGTHGVAFYTILESGELAAGKAYLQLPTASVADVKALNIIFDDDDEDGICSPTFTPYRNGEEVYNLQGQRIEKIQKGIYIVNGKKLFIK